MSFSWWTAPSWGVEIRPKEVEEEKKSGDVEDDPKNLDFEDPFDDEFIEEEVVGVP